MPEHRYQQFCGLARALDVAGDRWTLLIVRELVLGPRRFTDLIEGLPGVSRNLLAERLRALESDGIIARQELAPPAARQVYELTDDGHDLAVAMAPVVWPRGDDVECRMNALRSSRKLAWRVASSGGMKSPES